jgi:polyphenol oxidase
MNAPRPGVAFTDAGDGDVRGDPSRRLRVSEELGIPGAWAVGRQVHGADVTRVTAPGDAGEVDALFTTVPHLPLAVFTADCLGVSLVGRAGVGVAHAGWRGMAAGVIGRLVEAMTAAGAAPDTAYAGPVIGPCCFEVGPEVAETFPSHRSVTSSGSVSVDLLSAARDQLGAVELHTEGGCTRHDDRYLSHRRDRTLDRMAALAWLGD